MEGNFETSSGGGGFSGGGNLSDPGGSMEFDSNGSLMDSGQISNSGSDFSLNDYLKEGVDKGYYKTETEGIFTVDEVMAEAQTEMKKDEKDFDIMDIPGSSHEKLSSLAQMSDEDIKQLEETEMYEPKISVESNKKEDTEKGKVTHGQKAESPKGIENQPSFEEQVIKLQAEAIKLMAEGMNSKVNEKDLEELMKKLKKLLAEMEGEKETKGSKKTTLLSGVFTAIALLLKMGEESYKKLENEVKEVEK